MPVVSSVIKHRTGSGDASGRVVTQPLAGHQRQQALTARASGRFVVRTRNRGLLPSSAGTKEATMIVKNVLLGKCGNLVTIDSTADLAAAVKLLTDGALQMGLRSLGSKSAQAKYGGYLAPCATSSEVQRE